MIHMFVFHIKNYNFVLNLNYIYFIELIFYYQVSAPVNFKMFTKQKSAIFSENY